MLRFIPTLKGLGILATDFIKGAVLVKNEEIIPERLTEEEKNERIKVISYYAKKYPHLTIEQIGQLIDDSNLGLGEEFVINKILETYR